jgi:hypothetical protein
MPYHHCKTRPVTVNVKCRVCGKSFPKTVQGEGTGKGDGSAAAQRAEEDLQQKIKWVQRYPGACPDCWAEFVVGFLKNPYAWLRHRLDKELPDSWPNALKTLLAWFLLLFIVAFFVLLIWMVIDFDGVWNLFYAPFDSR